MKSPICDRLKPTRQKDRVGWFVFFLYTSLLFRCVCVCARARSAGVWWRFLKGAECGSVEGRSIGGQPVDSRVLGGPLRLRLGGNLSRLLVLVFLRGAGAAFGHHLGSCWWLVAVGVLWRKKLIKVTEITCFYRFMSIIYLLMVLTVWFGHTCIGMG